MLCRQWFSSATGIPVLSDGRITPLVYVGPQHSRLGKWRLELAGIKHVVNMRMEFNDADHNLALKSYCHLPTEDNHFPALEQLESGVAFIQQAVDRQEKVYIHCKRGRGRAPTLAAAFLISRGLTVLEAVNLLHQARRSTTFTPTQRAQLQAFYGAIRQPLQRASVQTLSPIP